MLTKILEVRDRLTFIPVLAIRFNGSDHRLLHAVGYHPESFYVVVVKLSDGEARNDPHGWTGSRTLRFAHLHIEKEWHTLKDGDVVDVEFILGETPEPKTPQGT